MGILGAFVVPHPAVIVPEIGKGPDRFGWRSRMTKNL